MMHALKRYPLLQKAVFTAMPLLAAGIMLSCKGESDSSYENDTPRPAKTAPKASPKNAHSASPKSSSSNSPKTTPAKKNRGDSDYTIGDTTGCPDWMVRIPAAEKPHKEKNPGADYCIDRFEDYIDEWVDGKWAYHDSSVKPKNKKIKAMVSSYNYPQPFISRPEAEAACKNAGKRLCTLDEWKKACMGEKGYTYPYGNTEKPNIRKIEDGVVKLIKKGACNTGEEHQLSEIFGMDNGKWTRDAIVYPLLVRSGLLQYPGAYASCVSSYGVYDMVGNLQEWTSTPVTQEMISSRPPGGDKRNPNLKPMPGFGIFMGTYFSGGYTNGPGCHYITIAHPPDHYDYSVGFRCCKDADMK